MSSPAPAPAESAARSAPLSRRLASFLYEGVLLFGITFGVGLVYGVLTQQHHALAGRTGLIAVQFGVIGLYFVVCWSRNGQTLPMQTWHIRLVTRDGGPVSPWRALARYLAAYVWFLPALAAVHLAGVQTKLGIAAALVGWIAAYAASSRLRADGQFWHDAVCGTRLIDWRPPRPAAA